jgi:hypothetical protein
MSHNRNVTKKRFCPGCEHSHFPHDDVSLSGMCLLNPPKCFLLGMQPSAIQSKSGDPAQMLPVLRSWFPPVSAGDTCSKWEQRAEGEA